jgi:ribosomal protein S18 acetylase RimI-like enzyme
MDCSIFEAPYLSIADEHPEMVAEAFDVLREAFGANIEFEPNPERHATEDIRLHIAEIGGFVVGACVSSTQIKNAAHGWIDFIGVLPDYSGAGIGKSLAASAEGHFRAHGQQESRLSPVTSDPRTMQFWRNAGYIYNEMDGNPTFTKVL